MQQLDWISGKLPRMVIVQSDNCAPMMHMYKSGEIPPTFNPLPSMAYGLAVPYPFAKDLMVNVINESNGTVVTVSEKDIEDGVKEIASEEGFLLSPEGSSTFKAMEKLLQTGWIKEEETVLLFNTGSWYKYR
jgi:threonine synthase